MRYKTTYLHLDVSLDYLIHKYTFLFFTHLPYRNSHDSISVLFVYINEVGIMAPFLISFLSYCLPGTLSVVPSQFAINCNMQILYFRSASAVSLLYRVLSYENHCYCQLMHFYEC